MTNIDAVTALAALAQDSRLAIFRLLVQNVPGKRIGSYGYDGSLTISGAYVPSRPDSFTTYGKDVTS